MEAINMIIVTTLHGYGRLIPIDFLAKRLRRNRTEILEPLDTLEQAGIIYRDNDHVKLREPVGT